MAEYFVEGGTEPIDYQLFADGAVFPLTGCTVALAIYDRYDVAATVTGTLSVLDSAQGKVRFSPAANDLLHSKAPYSVRYLVTNAAGKILPFPRDQAAGGAPEIWRVQKP